MTEAIESSKDQKSSIIQYPPDSKLTHYSWNINFSYEKKTKYSALRSLFIFRSLVSDYLISKVYCQTNFQVMFLRKSVKNNFQTRTKAIKFAIIMNRKQRLSQNSFEKKVSNNEQETKAQSKQL